MSRSNEKVLIIIMYASLRSLIFFRRIDEKRLERRNWRLAKGMSTKSDNTSAALVGCVIPGTYVTILIFDLVIKENL